MKIGVIGGGQLGRMLALAGTPLGRAFLLGMSGFWALRLATQFVWLRVNHPLVHALSLAFALGAIVFALAASAG